MPFDQKFYPEVGAGGFSRWDADLQFYCRVNALLRPGMVVVDIGAGRGQASDDIQAPFRRDLVTLKGKAKEVIGVDVDEAVRVNPGLDRAIVYDGTRIPLPDDSVDLVVSDWTLEHIPDAELFASEVNRILKPGGWFCARTPHLYSLLVVAASLIPNKMHVAALKAIQPDRKVEDVFPTRYKLNTKSAIRRLFPSDRWANCTYTHSANPPYHFNNTLIHLGMQAYQYLKRPLLGGEVLLVFLQKKETAEAIPVERAPLRASA
jgi:SAM-dependent methyltransferase